MSPEKEVIQKKEEDEVQPPVEEDNAIHENAAAEDGVLPAAQLVKEAASTDPVVEEAVCQNGDHHDVVEGGGEVRVNGEGGEGGDIGTSEC